jgi:periplasmic divalent cation tolerance protein
MKPEDGMRVVFVTCPPDQADKLVLTLLEERLIACGNIVPGVRSHYWWEGKVCTDDEAILLMETARDRVAALMTRLREIHPYTTPKIVTFSVEEHAEAYYSWVQAMTRPPAPEPRSA